MATAEPKEEEHELFGVIDDTKKQGSPKIEVSVDDAEAMSAASLFKDLFSALATPIAAFVVGIGGAFLVINSGNEIALLLFPYMIAVLNFLGAVPSITKNLNGAFNLASSIISSTLGKVDSEIGKIEEGALGALTKVEKAIEDALEPIRPKLDQATKMENMLKKLDSDIDIPDTSDIEEELDDAGDMVNASISKLKDGVNLLEYLPKPLQKKEYFAMYVIYPILAIYGLIMILVAFFSASGGSSDEPENQTRYLRGGPMLFDSLESDNSVYVTADAFPIFTNSSSNSTAVPDEAAKTISDNSQTFMVVVQSVLVSVLLVLLIFVSTLKQVVQSFIKKKIQTGLDDLNDSAKETLEPFQQVFVVSMDKIKERFQKLLSNVDKIESKLPKKSFRKIF